MNHCVLKASISILLNTPIKFRLESKPELKDKPWIQLFN